MHGVLRLILETKGESLNKITPEIGFLHRGTEKLCESVEYYKILPYFDRFDYVSSLAGEELYSLVIEKALQVAVPSYSGLAHTLLVKLNRVFKPSISNNDNGLGFREY